MTTKRCSIVGVALVATPVVLYAKSFFDWTFWQRQKYSRPHVGGAPGQALS